MCSSEGRQKSASSSGGSGEGGPDSGGLLHVEQSVTPRAFTLPVYVLLPSA